MTTDRTRAARTRRGRGGRGRRGGVWRAWLERVVGVGRNVEEARADDGPERTRLFRPFEGREEPAGVPEPVLGLEAVEDARAVAHSRCAWDAWRGVDARADGLGDECGRGGGGG